MFLKIMFIGILNSKKWLWNEFVKILNFIKSFKTLSQKSFNIFFNIWAKLKFNLLVMLLLLLINNNLSVICTLNGNLVVT